MVKRTIELLQNLSFSDKDILIHRFFKRTILVVNSRISEYQI